MIKFTIVVLLGFFDILSKTNIFFSRFEGTRGENKTNISHPNEMRIEPVGLLLITSILSPQT